MTLFFSKQKWHLSTFHLLSATAEIFNFPMTDITYFSIFIHMQRKKTLNFLDLKSTSILNISALLLFEKLQFIHLLFGQNGTLFKTKNEGWEQKCKFSQLCKQLVALKRILMCSMFILLPNHAKFKNIRPN